MEMEMKILYDGDGIVVYKDGENYFLRYDGGEIAMQMVNQQITKEEAFRIIYNPMQESYNIMIHYKNIARGFNDF